MSESTRSDDHSPDQNPGTGIPTHTCNTMEMGTVLPRYSNFWPVPVTMHTHNHIITGLPIPRDLHGFGNPRGLQVQVLTGTGTGHS